MKIVFKNYFFVCMCVCLDSDICDHVIIGSRKKKFLYEEVISPCGQGRITVPQNPLLVIEGD